MKDCQYELLGRTIIVQYMPRVEVDDHWVFGMCKHDGDITNICISTESDDGKKMSKDSMQRTLRHELYHVICDIGQYFHTSEDEPLIEWLAICTDLLNKQGAKI